MAKNLNLDINDLLTDTLDTALETPLLEARDNFVREWHEGVKRAIGKYGTSPDRQRYKKIAQEFLTISRKRLERSEAINKAYDELRG